MAKQKLYFYECVMQIDMTYKGYEHRIDRKHPDNLYGVQERMHPLRFKPADPYKKRDADILVTERPLTWHFTDARDKMIKRTTDANVPGKHEMRAKTTKVKFRLLDPDEVSQAVKDRAIRLELREFDHVPEPEPKPGPKVKVKVS